jgi:hypothetical protein
MVYVPPGVVERKIKCLERSLGKADGAKYE